MQVERRSWSLLQDISGGRASNTWATCPADRDNSGKPVLIPNSLRPLMRPHGKTVSAVTAGWARGALASWWGNGLPRQRCVADLRGRSEEHTSELQSREKLVCRLLLEKKNGSRP